MEQEGSGGRQSSRSLWQVTLRPLKECLKKTPSLFLPLSHSFSHIQMLKAKCRWQWDFVSYSQSATVKAALIPLAGEWRCSVYHPSKLKSLLAPCSLLCMDGLNYLQWEASNFHCLPSLCSIFKPCILFFTTISASNDYLANSFNTSLHPILGKK
jgi:hypothetical protein